MVKAMASLQAFPSFLLAGAWSRALIPFLFPFERLACGLTENRQEDPPIQTLSRMIINYSLIHLFPPSDRRQTRGS